MTERRRFSGREATALYLAADGKCQICGEPLASGWHADHVRPWSRGGATEVLNGQALCATCNLKKGARMDWVGPWPEDKGLREWQRQAVLRVMTHEASDFLCVATPGAGKTIFSLRVAHNFLSDGRVQRVVVVCPTEHLKYQWAEAAQSVGIALDASWENRHGAEARDYRGVVATYQQITSGALVQRAACGRTRTLVILDEIHHAGERRSWGASLREAFVPAEFRLLLSGTPFRSDGHAIPFVSYSPDEKGVMRSRADFDYGYGPALGDEVCRPVLFPSFDGRVEWEWKGRFYSRTLTEECHDAAEHQRLAVALDPAQKWLRAVLAQANGELAQARRYGHPNAGGLVVARDQKHAQAIARLLRDVAGEEPSVAVSDDPQASEVIERFAKGSGRWIVAVRMVSEGVDIPRLRVGVYATNVLTELFFRQVVGRLVRRTPDLDEQSAYLFIPAIDALLGYAETIKEERDHTLQEEEERVLREAERLEELLAEHEGDPPPPAPQPVETGEADLHEVVVPGGERVKADEFEEARQYGAAVGFTSLSDFAKLALAKRLWQQASAAATVEAPAADAAQEAQTPVFRLKQRLRRLISRKVAELHRRSGQPYDLIHDRMNRLDGVRGVDDCTVKQLEGRVERLNAWIGGDLDA